MCGGLGGHSDGHLEAEFSDVFSRFPLPDGHGQLWFLMGQCWQLASDCRHGWCFSHAPCRLAGFRERHVLFRGQHE